MKRALNEENKIMMFSSVAPVRRYLLIKLNTDLEANTKTVILSTLSCCMSPWRDSCTVVSRLPESGLDWVKKFVVITNKSVYLTTTSQNMTGFMQWLILQQAGFER